MANEPLTPSDVVCASHDTMAVVESTLLKLWSAANELARVRPPSGQRRVTIFGSARIKAGDPVYGEVVRLCASLAAAGCDIVTGGGPGLMQAAAEGERLGDPSGRTRSVGILIDLPFEDGANPIVETVYTHQTFFTRLHHFVRLSDAFVVVPGGVGTCLELLMVWQLLQVKHLADVKLIVVGTMWRELVEWARRHMIYGEVALASAADMDLPVCVDTAREAAELITSRLGRVEVEEPRR